MKIYVYAIAKDETAFVKRWMNSMSEADGVFVLDTGSTDGTDTQLEELGAHVFRDYQGEYFRFDSARNQALAHVPEDADICVSTDIDEVWEQGWRAKLESAWTSVPNCNNLKYKFVFTTKKGPNGEEVPDSVFFKNNAHARHGFRWTCPCHEVLVADVPIVQGNATSAILQHKSQVKQRRGQYLGILERGAKDEPNDARIHYYLGREYFYLGRWMDAVDTLVKYLDLAGQYCWHDEKGNAIYMIAQCFKNDGDLDRAESWALRGIAETEGRENALLLAKIYHDTERWWEGRYWANKAKEYTNNFAYFREPWTFGPYVDAVLCKCNFQLGDREAAKRNAIDCLKAEPNNKLYRDNAAFFGLIDPNDPSQDIAAEPEEMAVAFSCTKDFNRHLEVSLYSLLRYNKVRDLYLITEGGRDENLINIAKRFEVKRIHFLNIDSLLHKYISRYSPNKKPVCTKATLGRLFLAAETKEDKILYLDTDTITTGNLCDLWRANVDGKAFAGVIDNGALEIWGDYTKTLKYGGIQNYINAGVLLLNLAFIRGHRLDVKAIDLLNTIPYQFADQDVLNVAANGCVTVLGNEFNSGIACGISQNPKIIHFVSIADFYQNPHCEIWQKTREEYEAWKTIKE